MTPWQYHLYAIKVFYRFDRISAPRKPKRKKKKAKRPFLA